MGSENLHESPEHLSELTRNMHRAIVSLIEELEAIDWYQQRAEACSDSELREVLLHNKEEEVEHAMMVLEWLRRNDQVFDRNMRSYLFTDRPITSIEDEREAEIAAKLEHEGAAPGAASDGSLGLGRLEE